MTAINWIPEQVGTAAPASDADHPNAYRLISPGRYSSERFEATPTPTLDDGRLQFSLRGGDYHVVYVQLETSSGPREVRISPRPNRARLRFDYRYELGLGRAARDGRWHDYDFDLAAVAQQLEPGISLVSMTSLVVRVSGTVTVDIPDGPEAPEFELTRAEAVRFLNQATFGARSAEIDELMNLGDLATWIDGQFGLPMSRTYPYVRDTSNGSYRGARHVVWWRNAMEGADQLRQRVAFALSEIFVISDRDYELGNNQYGVTDWYDMLAAHADGNFRDLLTDVTLHPVMGIYLSMIRNEQADPSRNIRPDENYARELLQLFTIGLYELDQQGTVLVDDDGPRPTYSQETVEEFARVFTGWNYRDEISFTSNNLDSDQRRLPMTPVEDFHDSGAKQLLSGVTAPAGLSARADLDFALDNVFAHPNVGPFIARSLIQRLVTSNPTPGYIGRIAAVFNDDGTGVRGDLRATVTALLLDPEARFGPAREPAVFGKVKEPLLRLTQVWRALDAQPGAANPDSYRPYSVSGMSQIDDVVGQSPLESPSVFNFFTPGYRPRPDGPRAPEMQILTEALLASANNMFHTQIYGFTTVEPFNDRVTLVSLDRPVALADDPPSLLDWADEILFGGLMPIELRNAVIAHISTLPTDAEGLHARASDAVFTCIASPAFLLQR